MKQNVIKITTTKKYRLTEFHQTVLIWYSGNR